MKENNIKFYMYLMIKMNLQNLEQLESMKNSIESMSKFHQIEILKILSKHLCKINENKSGVYINLSFLSEETIEEMKGYIDYVKNQEESLKTVEYQKEEFKNTFFYEKQDKDETILYNETH